MSLRLVLPLLAGALCSRGQLGPCPPSALLPAPGTGGTSFTTTAVNVFAVTNNTVDVETFLTQITARLNGGAPLYDQSFPAALADSTVQAGITQARNAIMAAASPQAATITGPSRLSTARTILNTATATSDGTPVGPVLLTTTTVGPANILVGDNAAVTYCVFGGNINIDVKSTYTIPRTVTTTNTYRTTESYLIAGSSNGAAPVPVPPSVVLGLTGLLGAGLHEIRRRRRKES